jgi:alpha-ribazole phosphatase
MTKIIYVRHGQTLWNLEMKYQGHTDISLSSLGNEQAAAVANKLARLNISAVYSSDLIRAYDTAVAIAGKHGLTVQKEPAFREISFGEWEGLTYDSIYSGWPDIMGELYSRPDEVEIPGGESFRQLKKRAVWGIDQLMKKHPDETIVVVSHGGTIRTILCAALNIHLNYVWNIKQDNTAVNIIEYYPERTIVCLLNDTSHLPTSAFVTQAVNHNA